MRIVIHVDMDAFFAACEERYNPSLRGLPIVVGADPKGGRGRGVVSTANYKAREFGIHSAMPISTAWRLAEAARRKGAAATVFLRPNSELYQEVSRRIMAIAERGIDSFEEASIDEIYLDVSSLDSFVKAEKYARQLKEKILKPEGLTCSVGIGPNKLIAKIASGFKKPDGLVVVRPDEVQGFLDPLPIREIPGIGPKTEIFLKARGIRTIQELRQISETELVGWFGKPRRLRSGSRPQRASGWGHDLYRKVRGIDDSPVTNEWIPKSIGEQETFELDTLAPSFILAQAKGLAANVFRRFHSEGFSSLRTVTVTVRFADFETTSRSHTARKPLASERVLQGEVLRLLLPFLDQRQNPRRKKIRLIGVRVEKLGRVLAPLDSGRDLPYA